MLKRALVNLLVAATSVAVVLCLTQTAAAASVPGKVSSGTFAHELSTAQPGASGSVSVGGANVSWSKSSTGKVTVAIPESSAAIYKSEMTSQRAGVGAVHPDWPWDDICAYAFASAVFGIGAGVIGFLAATGGEIVLLGVTFDSSALGAIASVMGSFSATEGWFAANWC